MVNYIYIENHPFNLDFQIYLLDLSKVDCYGFLISSLCVVVSHLFIFVHIYALSFC